MSANGIVKCGKFVTLSAPVKLHVGATTTNISFTNTTISFTITTITTSYPSATSTTTITTTTTTTISTTTTTTTTISTTRCNYVFTVEGNLFPQPVQLQKKHTDNYTTMLSALCYFKS